jgi:hypothetical protein
MPLRSRNQDDYIERLIRQAAEAVRRLRERLTGTASASAEVVAAARAAQGELLGDEAGLLQHVDAATAAWMVRDAERVRLWAELLRVEAAAHRQGGAADVAARLEARAALLARAADGLTAGR